MKLRIFIIVVSVSLFLGDGHFQSFSKKTFTELEPGEAYQRGTFLIVLATACSSMKSSIMQDVSIIAIGFTMDVS